MGGSCCCGWWEGFAKEGVETSLQREGLVFEVGEYVEGVVEGGEEGAEAAGRCKKPVVLVSICVCGWT